MLRPKSTSLLIASLLAACGGGGGGDTVGVCVPAASSAPLAGGPSLKDESSEYGQLGDAAAYADGNSFAPGDTITFHGASIGLQIDPWVWFEIRRVGDPTGPDDYIEGRDIPSFAVQPVPDDDAWEKCCDWPPVHQFTIPADWKSGLYYARFNGGSQAFFVVRAEEPGTTSKIVVSVPFTTAYAYDNWGGKSVYNDKSSNNAKASRVSLSRPFAGTSEDKFRAWMTPFVRWAEQEHIDLEFIANTDLHKSPGILDPYDLFVTVGHDEYWSSEMRAELERHLDAGGNAAFFSGNNMWWRIRFEAPGTDGMPNGRMLVDKVNPPDGSPPPEGAAADAHEGHWYWVDPEVSVLGAGYARGGWNRDGNDGEIPDFTVHQPGHWAFEGTGLAQGSAFGKANGIVNFESDGADFTWTGPGGLPEPTGSDGAPENLTILATAPLQGWQSDFEEETGNYYAGKSYYTGEPGSWATMVAYDHPGGGKVFNAATVDWAYGLAACGGAAYECKITKNVIDKLKTAHKGEPGPAPAPEPGPAPAPEPGPAPAPEPGPAPAPEPGPAPAPTPAPAPAPTPAPAPSPTPAPTPAPAPSPADC